MLVPCACENIRSPQRQNSQDKMLNQQESRLCLGAQASREQTDQPGEANPRNRSSMCVSTDGAAPSE